MRSSRVMLSVGIILQLGTDAKAVPSERSDTAGLFQVLVEVRDGAIPRELRGLGTEAISRVVVEAVLRARIDVTLVAHVGGLERRFIRRPSGDQALVERAVVHQHRGLDV